jgi:hypothetical protein
MIWCDMRRIAMVISVASMACGGGQSTPTAPTASSPTSPAAPATSSISATLTATNGGQPLAGVAVSVEGVTATTTDGSGQFAFTASATTTQATLAFAGPAIVPRRLTLATRTRSVNLDAIELAGGFSIDFYRQFVRNGLEQPGALQLLRRWQDHPKVYLRTVFGAGREMDAGTLDSVATALVDWVRLWSGGRLSVAIIERGAEDRADAPGWINVGWSEELGERACGRARIGANPGRIELHPRNAGCWCVGDPGQVSRSVVAHEVGHAMGFWHTEGPENVMYNTFNACNVTISARERLHAAISYSRPPGNVDPDTDPSSSIALTPLTSLVP